MLYDIIRPLLIRKSPLFLLSLLSSLPVFAGDWVDLFNGQDLSGWTQKNGTATYVVEKDEDGSPMIVGTTKKGSPNSFLCTDEIYGDFELEFDVWVDSKLNSGVQIRSTTKHALKPGRVNGPQVEVEATAASHPKGGHAGYIYGEACGGWLTPNELRIERTVMMDDQWNHFRVVAEGARIQVWVNGEQISDLTHEKKFESHPEGFIGLQVHGIPRAAPNQHLQVRWKNLKIRTLN